MAKPSLLTPLQTWKAQIGFSSSDIYTYNIRSLGDILKSLYGGLHVQ